VWTRPKPPITFRSIAVSRTRYTDPRAFDRRALRETLGGDEMPVPVESVAEHLLRPSGTGSATGEAHARPFDHLWQWDERFRGRRPYA
jgi:hypothetical protein